MNGKHDRGVTLIEMMIVLVLSATALALAVPAFDGLITSSRMRASVVDLVSTLNRARSEAIARKRQVIVCSSSIAESASPDCEADSAWTSGWLVYADEDSSGGLNSGDVVLAVHGALSGVTEKAASQRSVAYRSDGTAAASAVLDLCGVLKPDYGRRLSIALSGRIRTSEVDNLCP